jgi:hypothetical protein
MANFIMGIISISVGAVILAGVFMNSVHGLFSTNLTGCVGISNGTNGCNNGYQMNSTEYALWGLLGICAIAGIVYGTMNIFGIV